MNAPVLIWLAITLPLFALWVFLLFRHLWRLAFHIRPQGQDHLGGIASQQRARNKAAWAYLKDPVNGRSFLFIGALTLFILGFNAAMLTWIEGL